VRGDSLSFDAASPLTPHRSRGASVLSRKGRAGSSLHRSGTPKRLAASQREGWKGVARRKAQTYGVAALAEPRGRLSARHMRSSSEAVAHAICSVCSAPGPAFGDGCTRKGRRSSASSWQGLLMVPGGAPMPPECRLCVRQPAGAAPRPGSRRLMNAPLNERGGSSVSEVGEAGIKGCHQDTLQPAASAGRDAGIERIVCCGGKRRARLASPRQSTTHI